MSLIQPHGGSLCDLLISEDERIKIQHETLNKPSITLNDRQLCDIEMLLNGGFSPLNGFMDQRNYESVIKDMRLVYLGPINRSLSINSPFSWIPGENNRSETLEASAAES